MEEPQLPRDEPVLATLPHGTRFLAAGVKKVEGA